MKSTPHHSQGIHHVTAIATDPQRNLEFYVGLLGLRMVKRTVNFDDPGTYHLYYGDRVGTPGTILTFFPWPRARRGTAGIGMTRTTSLAVPSDSLGRWQQRLREAGVVTGPVQERFDEAALPFLDPDGMKLELVATDEDTMVATWADGPVDPAMAIRGFHSVTLLQRTPEPTAAVLTEVLGFSAGDVEGDRHRFAVAGSAPGRYVDLLVEDGPHGNGAAGTVHHVAFRVADDIGQAELHQQLQAAGAGVSPIMDRQYFRSIYFREPGGVLFEVATDPPGFARDEEVENLGQELRLPPWYEAKRSAIEASLPRLDNPYSASAPPDEMSS